MKAKEYAKRYIEARDKKQGILDVANGMMDETKSMIEVRHVKTNEALFSVVNEQLNKYRAFVRLVKDPAIKEGGLRELILLKFDFLPPERIR